MTGSGPVSFAVRVISNNAAGQKGTNMSKANMKKAGAILAVVAVGVFMVNTLAKRVPAVATVRNTITAGV